MTIFLHLLETYKYLILFPIAIVEGPIVIVIASFLASLGLLNIFLVYIIGVAGDVIGDLVWYWVGRVSRYSLILRYGHYVGITEEKLRYAKQHFKNHLGKTIFFGKVVDVLNVAILITAGATRTDVQKYLAVITIAALVKVAFFASIGYYFGQSYVIIGRALNNIYLALAVILAVALGVFIIYKKVAEYLNKKHVQH